MAFLWFVILGLFVPGRTRVEAALPSPGGGWARVEGVLRSPGGGWAALKAVVRSPDGRRARVEPVLPSPGGSWPTPSVTPTDPLRLDSGARQASEQEEHPAAGQRDRTGTVADASRTAILELQAAPDPKRRREAASLLATVGSPGAVQALRVALTGDPDPSVRGAAARALGRLGPLARGAVPDLVRGLDDPATPGSQGNETVCSLSAGALGSLGRHGLDAAVPLAQAGVTGCGTDPSAPLAALSLLARDLSRVSSSLSEEELQAAMEGFQEARDILGPSFPPEAGQALAETRREVRARQMSWLGPAAYTMLAAGGGVISLLRRVGGVLAAILFSGLVLLALRNAGRFLPRLADAPEGKAWPFRVLVMGGSQRFMLKAVQNGKDRAATASEAGKGDREGGSKRSSEILPHDPDCSPRGSRIDVILGEIQDRYRYVPGAPSREDAQRILQALAWMVMQNGRLEGWVAMEEIPELEGLTDLEETLEFLQDSMDMARWDPAGRRVRLTLGQDETAHLGSLFLLKEVRAGPREILAHLGAFHHRAARSRGRKEKGRFLHLAAQALLEVAHAMEGEAPPLGVAEEALRTLTGAPDDGVQGNEGSWEGAGGGAGGIPMEAGGGRKPGGSGTPESAARLRRLTGRLHSEEHPAVRERVISAMGGMGPEATAALPLLMEAVEREPPGVALAALDTLGRIGPGAEEAAPILLETLKKGRPAHRLAATRALGRLGPRGEEAAPTLLSWVSKDGIPHELKAGAAEALGGMPGQAEAAIPPLLELLRSPVATEVRAAAALALARLDPGRNEVRDALTQAGKVQDGALQGMVAVAFLVREERLGKAPRREEPVDPARWLVPMGATAGVLGVLQLGAVVGSEVLSPGTILPALFVGPVMAFLAGITYAVATRRLPLNPALGSGAAAWVGASMGLLLGFPVSTALTPLALVVGGGMALASGVFGGALVYTAISEP